jgi:hypothetical protein
MTTEESNYGKFHVIAILMIVLIFLLKLSSSSIPNKQDHDELGNQKKLDIITAKSNLARSN